MDRLYCNGWPKRAQRPSPREEEQIVFWEFELHGMTYKTSGALEIDTIPTFLMRPMPMRLIKELPFFLNSLALSYISDKWDYQVLSPSKKGFVHYRQKALEETYRLS